MKTLLKEEKGAILLISIAIIAVVVSIVSAASLVAIAQSDQLATQYEQDIIQEELLLRSEAVRTSLSMEYDKNGPLAPRKTEISSSNRIASYTITNSKHTTVFSSFMGYATQEGIAVRSLITAKRSSVYSFLNSVPAKRYTERILSGESLAQYQYFTDDESSENADGGTEDVVRVKFWGPDVLTGKVHSNDDIWIQQAGGGNNNGWPTFNEMVTTAGIFRKYPGGAHLPDTGAPMEQIFQGGWQENVPAIVFNPTADDIRNNGISPFDPEMEIVYVKIDGSSFTSMYGDIQLAGIDTFGVYSWYPANAQQANAVINAGGNWFEDSDHIWTNSVAIYDTVWTAGPGGSINNQCVWVDNELWIEGRVSGKQTWGSADTVFVVNDIIYSGTQPGDSPDGDNFNRTDYFGLVSEKKILIRYKHKDPFENMALITDNCNGIYLYGAYAAIGEGDPIVEGEMACHSDGIFTFQYQHPHGSTPDFIGPNPYIQQTFTIHLIDTGGNGWEGAWLDVYLNGEAVLNHITCIGGSSSYPFTVDNGDVIQTQYTQGNNEDEHLYEILNESGDVVANDGPNPGPGIFYQALLPATRDTLYTYIDLHKFIFPPSNFTPPAIQGFNLHGNNPVGPYNMCGYPYEDPGYLNSYPNNGPNYAYPYGTDYPWYNPIWPEPANTIVTERGNLYIFGAIAQRRRGYIHRSGSDAYNHIGNAWDIEHFRYDGTHPSTGYDKNYHYDQRFMFVQPPCYPQIYRGFGESTITSFDENSMFFKVPPR